MWKWLLGAGAVGAAVAYYYLVDQKSTVIPGVPDKTINAIPDKYRPEPQAT